MTSKAEPCVWMKENKELKCYEYIATYDDDLCVAAQDPSQIIQILKEDYKLKIIRDGPLNHHFGADSSRDKDKTLVCWPKKYIGRLLESYQSMFKQDPPKTLRSLMAKNDHPELDDTELLIGKFIQHYVTMIGQLQCLLTLGRFDIRTQVTTLSRFRSAPRKGHLQKPTKDLCLCQKDQTFFHQIQDKGTRLQLPSQHTAWLALYRLWQCSRNYTSQEIISNDYPIPLGKISDYHNYT